MPEIINDSAFMSLSTGLGMLGSDKTLDAFVSAKPFNFGKQKEYDALYEINNFAANVVDLLPDAMAQKPAKITIEGDEKLQKTVQLFIDSITPEFAEATKLARQCGGSGILLGNGDTNISKPLNPKNPIQFFNVLQGGVNGILQIHAIDTDPLSENFDKPLVYRMKNTDQFVHYSRIIPFYGIKLLTDQQKQRYKYWGLPVLHRSYSPIKHLDIADSAIANAIAQFSRLVYEIMDMQTLLSSDQGKALLKARMDAMNYSWNILKTLPIQVGEKVSNLKTDFTGVDIALAHFKEMVAGSSDIPYNKIFNTSSGGTSLSNGQSVSHAQTNTSEVGWTAYVNSCQNTKWKKPLENILKIQFPVLEKSIYTLEFPSIMLLTDGEIAALDQVKANTEKTKQETENLKKQKPDNITESIKEDLTPQNQDIKAT